MSTAALNTVQVFSSSLRNPGALPLLETFELTAKLHELSSRQALVHEDTRQQPSPALSQFQLPFAESLQSQRRGLDPQTLTTGTD